MRTILKLSALLLFLASAVRAQGPVIAGMGPVIEAGFGYSYVMGTVPSETRLTFNGVQATANADLQRHFGVKLEVGYARNFDAFNTGRTADMLTYLGGPVFYPIRKRNMNVFTHILLGGARETGVNFDNSGQMVIGFVNRFAWAGGAGLQYRMTRSLSVRVGADYLRTSYFNSNIVPTGQSNLRTSINVMYTIGERE